MLQYNNPELIQQKINLFRSPFIILEDYEKDCIRVCVNYYASIIVNAHIFENMNKAVSLLFTKNSIYELNTFEQNIYSRLNYELNHQLILTQKLVINVELPTVDSIITCGVMLSLYPPKGGKCTTQYEKYSFYTQYKY